ncbi:AraC family transcriptional regulator [Colwelliaceae bacterium 6441]
MKPIFEKVVPSENSSWRYWLYEVDELEFHWHYHPEYEIALTLNSHGQRYVGDSIESYADYDIALLGPHLPHTWYSAASIKGKAQKVYVAQIPTKWIEGLVFSVPDFFEIKHLLERSQRGIKFSKKTAMASEKLFKKMHHGSPLQRFNGLMAILQMMIEDKEAQVLSSAGFNIAITSDPSTDKLDKIFQFIHENYTNNIKADEVAALVHMSTNHFHRFIKQRTEQTFTEIVNQLRISKACSLLINTQKPITTISDMCGFNNISNFNRRFLQFKQMKPSEFKKVHLSKNLLI